MNNIKISSLNKTIFELINLPDNAVIADLGCRDAGFLLGFQQAFPGKIINIHPSLIPSFCGVGYYGLKVHEKALERGVKVTGATVHFVDGGMDTGPIIAQKAVYVQPGDTPEVLQRRVMEEAEWLLLPQAIDDIANGRI